MMVKSERRRDEEGGLLQLHNTGSCKQIGTMSLVVCTCMTACGVASA